jgi:imidazoleglycerol-phosphate dehydratase/histidinol-phosphatase
MKKVLFIDRDGTIIKEPPVTFQIDSLEKFEFLPGVLKYLGNIAQESEYELVMVSNQDGLGGDEYPERIFQPLQDLLLRTMAGEGIHFEAIHIDRSFPHEGLATRKPGIGMLGKYVDGSYDLKNSFVIGDRITDIKLAENLGAQVIFIPNHEDFQEKTNQIACVAGDWKEIYEFLTRKPRIALHQRKTNETDIRIELNLDGTGKSSISTGLGFFDHMLDQLARHGNFDLEISAIGDLHIDEHHTVEDTAIALGEAFQQALGDKRGIDRYGFLLPMDDCLAQVAVDFGGRNWLVWDAEFKREKIGEVSTELFFHFFKSFSDASRSNLNIKAEGSNEHHKIESIFKAFAKALKMAVRKEPGNTQLPSTKGAL